MMICVTDWVENIVGKGEYAVYQHFLLFPQCFQRASFSGSLKVGIVWKKVKTFVGTQSSGNVPWSSYSVINILFNPFPNKPWFLRVCSTSLLKTLWEKEKLLIMSNFSFSHNVFYPFEELSSSFINFEIVV